MKDILQILKMIVLLPFHWIKSMIRNKSYGKLNEERIKEGKTPVKY